MKKYLTPDGLEKLKKELEHLEKTGRREMAERLKHAISFGDLSENAAYEEAKDAQGFLERRISELKGIISSANVVKNNGSKEAQVGSFVLLSCGNKKEEYQIVGPEEVDVLKGKISYQSPLGRLICGKVKGEKITLKISDGKIEYQIIEVK